MNLTLTGFVSSGKVVLNIKKKHRKYFPYRLQLDLCTSKIKERKLEQ